ncbi:hypothetical protein FOA52_009706 [Chlamydomonas sp. UWO 241]|nr:hypothetical protein FOA52_009706 [Chlamydomonas sp. UWO 241]
MPFLLLPLLLALALAPVSTNALAHDTIRSAVRLDPSPSWPLLFSSDFNESSIILFTRATNGTWWYDAESGVEVVTRADGRGDRFCGSIHSLDPTPCTNIVTGGYRYIVFPELNECCRCCSIEAGCGVTSHNWLAGSDVKYLGTEKKNGLSTNKWVKQGLKPLYYWATADDTQTPVEIDESALWPKRYFTFHVDSFVAGEPIPPELLEVPANCSDKCPVKSICSVPGGKLL